MMNLAALANSVIQVVNPDYSGTVRRSDGYTTAADGGRTPAYVTFEDVAMQVQALAGDDLKHVDSLNIQGVKRVAFVGMRVQAVNKPGEAGGDLLDIPTGLSSAPVDTWLAVQVLEPWDVTGWCKVLLVLQ